MRHLTAKALELEGKETSNGLVGLLKLNGLRPTGNAAIDTEAAKRVAMKPVVDINSPALMYEAVKFNWLANNE